METDAHGQPRPLELGSSIDVSDGQTLDHIDFGDRACVGLFVDDHSYRVDERTGGLRVRLTKYRAS